MSTLQVIGTRSTRLVAMLVSSNTTPQAASVQKVALDWTNSLVG